MTGQLRRRYEAICAAAGHPAGEDMTVVFDAGQNSEGNFAHLAGTRLHYIGSVPASDCPDLTALPASVRSVVDEGRFGGLTAFDTRRQAYGAQRRAILTHSPELHQSQVRGFDATTLAKAGKKLDELAATLARGKTRRSRDKVEAEIQNITRKPWVRRVVTWHLAGDKPRDLRLTWGIDTAARSALEEELFGKHVLITSHDRWPVADVVAGYRSQSEAEFGFRQMKDPHVVSFSPMHHWTDHNIRIHVFTCVLALQIAHLMRYKAARQAGARPAAAPARRPARDGACWSPPPACRDSGAAPPPPACDVIEHMLTVVQNQHARADAQILHNRSADRGRGAEAERRRRRAVGLPGGHAGQLGHGDRQAEALAQAAQRLGDQAGLAHPAGSGHGHQAVRAGGVEEGGGIVVAAHEGGVSVTSQAGAAGTPRRAGCGGAGRSWPRMRTSRSRSTGEGSRPSSSASSMR